jgi:hypothetical protein
LPSVRLPFHSASAVLFGMSSPPVVVARLQVIPNRLGRHALR